MSKNKIEVSVKFKDNSNPISFDITRNNIFYGNNGKGKTRILKTIELLHGLAKSMDYNALISQLNDLNLSELKINKKNHSQLFAKYEENASKDQEMLHLFVKNNEMLLSQIIGNLKILSNKNINYNSAYTRRVFSTLTRLENVLNKKENMSISEFKEIFLMIFRLLPSRDRFFEEKLELFDNNHELAKNDLLNASRYIIEKLREFEFNIREQSKIIREELQREKERVLNALGKKGARYLTVDSNLEAEKIFKELSNKFEDINRQYLYSLWLDNDDIIKKEKIESYKNKFSLFNKIIANYNSIRIEFDFNEMIVFFKDNKKIDFLKLSSGEKRISIIFLNLIFSDEDIILIDEPEISLSLDYQNKIVRDIMQLTSESKKVMMATHAPYIYEDFISYIENNKVEV
ncbi:AAA family ATPase [Haemophilus haemolyticus]|uniref:AAA family ATPase n=1 Tax=Haemophilus haemolyticus TaxID=726 RepID=UPI0009BDEF63|nr:AAA family ATPase [Haemophilus haemolyticus]